MKRLFLNFVLFMPALNNINSYVHSYQIIFKHPKSSTENKNKTKTTPIIAYSQYKPV